MKIYLQSSVDFLIEKSVTDFEAKPTSSGALAIKTGLFTGRSPKDRFIVQDTTTREAVWWGDINLPLQTAHFEALENELLHFLTTIETYKRQSFVGADPRYRLAVETLEINCFTFSFQISSGSVPISFNLNKVFNCSSVSEVIDFDFFSFFWSSS